MAILYMEPNDEIWNQMTKIRALLNRTCGIFQRPFVGLPVLMWIYFVASYLLYSDYPAWRGELQDSDNFTYLQQTLDWIQGQGWFDNVQHRMSPPEGVTLHYTRLAEIPLAVFILFFRLFDYPWRAGALWASYAVPLAYLAALFWALSFAARRFVPKEWARLSIFIAIFCVDMLGKFAPGLASHHGLEAVLIMTALGLVVRMFASPDNLRWAVAAAFVFAFSLAIALEALPWIVLTVAVIGLWLLIEGKEVVRSGSIFGLGLAIFSLMFLACYRPAATLFKLDLLSYSIVYVFLEAGMALALGIAAFAGTVTSNVKPRVILGGVAAVVLGAFYLSRFPELLAGPYGAMDKRLNEAFITNITEAMPLVRRFGTASILHLSFLPVLALATSMGFVWRAKGAQKWNWGLLSFLLAISLGLSLFYQCRFYTFVQLFAIVPLTAFVERGWGWIGAHVEGRQRFLAEIGLLLLVGPLPQVLIPAALYNVPFTNKVLLFPVQTVLYTCGDYDMAMELNAPPYGNHKLRIMNMMFQGPEILFYTLHEVMAAPYHTNVRGNLDAIDFFRTSDPAEAEKIARRDKIDLVTMCHYVPDMYFKGSESYYFRQPDGRYVKRLPSGEVVGLGHDESFVWQLFSGKIPHWLRPGQSNALIFEVQPE